MLVATPTVPSLADRKPRVISEIRKVNVQRSPSLDGHPKLSGEFYHFFFFVARCFNYGNGLARRVTS